MDDLLQYHGRTLREASHSRLSLLLEAVLLLRLHVCFGSQLLAPSGGIVSVVCKLVRDYSGTPVPCLAPRGERSQQSSTNVVCIARAIPIKTDGVLPWNLARLFFLD